jgi:hypothetical protein
VNAVPLWSAQKSAPPTVPGVAAATVSAARARPG